MSDLSLSLTTTHEISLVFSFPCPVEKTSDRAALGDTWHPTKSNHIPERQAKNSLVQLFLNRTPYSEKTKSIEVFLLYLAKDFSVGKRCSISHLYYLETSPGNSSWQLILSPDSEQWFDLLEPNYNDWYKGVGLVCFCVLPLNMKGLQHLV